MCARDSVVPLKLVTELATDSQRRLVAADIEDVGHRATQRGGRLREPDRVYMSAHEVLAHRSWDLRGVLACLEPLTVLRDGFVERREEGLRAAAMFWRPRHPNRVMRGRSVAGRPAHRRCDELIARDVAGIPRLVYN